MNLSPLTAVGPVDGRYRRKTACLSGFFSEYALMRHRVLVEIEWLKLLSRTDGVAGARPLSHAAIAFLDALAADFSEKDAARVKEIEADINHDVKAVEYYLKERCRNNPELLDTAHFLHFACTSEDINSMAWGLMLKGARAEVLLPRLAAIHDALQARALEYAALPMLARTHGQPASPTTLGKEIAVFVHRLRRPMERIANAPIAAKMSGAVGNYNAHHAACPGVDWPALTAGWIRSLGLHPAPCTTQIEPHDGLVELLDAAAHAGRILLDLCRDVWGYISIGVFVQKAAQGEVGSSTMPHKVNPIDFENAEGNLGIACALARHLSDKLPVSRWQRDLSDSTAMRSLGTLFGHYVIAADSVLAGLDKLEADPAQMEAALAAHPEVLTEAIQTLLRKHRVEGAYEKIKALSRGRKMTMDDLAACVRGLDLPDEAVQQLLALTPQTYTGLAEDLARGAADKLPSAAEDAVGNRSP